MRFLFIPCTAPSHKASYCHTPSGPELSPGHVKNYDGGLFTDDGTEIKDIHKFVENMPRSKRKADSESDTGDTKRKRSNSIISDLIYFTHQQSAQNLRHSNVLLVAKTCGSVQQNSVETSIELRKDIFVIGIRSTCAPARTVDWRIR